MIPQIGLRAVYSWSEVSNFLGLSRRQTQHRVDIGLLVKRGDGQYPFFQKDVNAFLVRMNSGEYTLRRPHKVDKSSVNRILAACELLEGEHRA